MLTSARRANNDSDIRHMLIRRISAVFLALGTLWGVNVASAQDVMGLGDDAGLPVAGSVRLNVQSEWSYYDQRYVTAPGASGAGMLRPLGAAYTLDTLGAAQLPVLAPLQTELQALAGSSGVTVSLGRTAAQVTNRVTRVPIKLEAGLTRWFSLSATVPIVHTRSSVSFSANPTGTEGNLGGNPVFDASGAAAFDADTAFAQQMVRSAAAVAAYCGGSGAGSAECAGAGSLASDATGFGQSVGSVYGGSVLVPLQASALHAAIDARAQQFRNALNAFAGIPGSGVPAISATGVVGAATSLTTGGVQQILSDPSFGVQLDPLQTIERTHIGDVEVAAKVLLFDSFHARGVTRFDGHGLNARLSVGAGYRFPTGETDSPDNLTDVGTGTHASALLLRGYTDLMFGSHFWTSLVARYTRAGSDQLPLRYAAPGVVFPGLDTRVNVERQIGDMVELEATPRWDFNDFVAIGAQYLYRHKPADSYALAASSGGSAQLGFDPQVAAAGSDFTEHRLGGGVVFSNAHAVQLGRSHLPFDVSYMHSETIRGGAGKVPKLISDQIMVRVYYRVRR